MKPVRLTIQGLRSFRAEQTIVFEGLSFFAILGDTGAGKSSLLEAISYALFNAPTWEDRGVKELMSSGASAMRVIFEFEIAGRCYTITRMTPRNGAGQHLLECRDDPESRRDNERPVNEFIRDRLHIDRGTFLKTVVLPQGRFADLLLMPPGDRTKFLREILGFSVLEDVADRIRPRRDELHLALARLIGARTELPKDPAAVVASAAAELAAAESRHEALETLVARLATIEAQRRNHNADVAVQKGLERVLTSAATLFGELESIERLAVPLRERFEASERGRSSAESRLSAAAAEIERRRAEGEDAESLRRLDRTLEALVKLAEDDSRERETLVALEQQYVTMRETALVAAEHHERAIAALNEAQQGERKAVDTERTCEQALNAARETAKALATLQSSLQRVRGEMFESESALASATEKLSNAKARHADAESRFAAARNASIAAARSDAAAHAAAELHPGDECPICRQSLPTDYVAPSAPALDATRRVLKRAEDDHAQALRELASANAHAESAAARIAEKGDAIHRMQSALDEAIAAASDYALTGDVESDGPRLHALEKELDAAREFGEAAKQRVRTAVTAQIETAKRVSSVTAQLDATQQSIDSSRLRLGEIERRKDEEFERIAKSISKKKLASIDLLRVERSRIEGALTDAQTAEAEHIAALSAFGDAQTNLASALATLRSTVDDPRDDIFARLAPFFEMEEVNAACRALVQPARLGELSIPDFVAKARAEQARIASEIDTRLKEHTAALAAIDAQFAEALRVEEAGSLVELSAKRDESLERVAILRAQHRNACELERRVADVSTAIDRLEPQCQVHDELIAELAANRFPKFVVELKQLELLKVGTTILGRMTKDRYGFSSTLGIVDRTISQERKPRTLSGGETFLASLALSLALVEISERSGVHFESLFLDEGFGTLDPSAFEQALTELQHQVTQGRMIAVITHVERVTEFIDDIVHVTKTAEGSAVRVERTIANARAAH